MITITPKLWSRYLELKRKMDKPSEEYYEFDILACIIPMIDVIEAFENGTRNITKDYDLGELIHQIELLNGRIKFLRHDISEINTIRENEGKKQQ